MLTSPLAKRSIKLQNKVRALRLIACCASLRSPLIKAWLWTFIEEVWARSIGICELISIHSTPTGRLWVGERCSASANIYAREWFYFKLLKRKSTGRFFESLWLCKCRTCTLLRILLKSLMFKSNRRLAFVQTSIIMRLGLQNTFLQFVSLLSVASAKNLITLKPRCIRIKASFVRLNQALAVLEALSQTKVEIVKLNQRLVEKQISIYFHSEVPLPALTLAGERGLVKAINRFDFDCSTLFASYAWLWVKHELLKQFSLPRVSPPKAQRIVAYTFGDIGLWGLIQLAKGTTTLPPKVGSDDLQVRDKNVREVHYGLSLLPPRERRMLMLRCCRPKHTFRSIGEEYNLSKERVRQLCNRSIKRLESISHSLPTVGPPGPDSIIFHIDLSKPLQRFPSKEASASLFPSLSPPQRRKPPSNISPFGRRE
ncbi:MAG: sigma-70 family RNA polymerase sigma factor [Candidatus Hodgkinia cicadicola]